MCSLAAFRSDDSRDDKSSVGRGFDLLDLFLFAGMIGLIVLIDCVDVEEKEGADQVFFILFQESLKKFEVGVMENKNEWLGTTLGGKDPCFAISLMEAI